MNIYLKENSETDTVRCMIYENITVFSKERLIVKPDATSKLLIKINNAEDANVLYTNLYYYARTENLNRRICFVDGIIDMKQEQCVIVNSIHLRSPCVIKENQLVAQLALL